MKRLLSALAVGIVIGGITLAVLSIAQSDTDTPTPTQHTLYIDGRCPSLRGADSMPALADTWQEAHDTERFADYNGCFSLR